MWPYENKTVSITDVVNGKPLLVYPLSMFLLCGIKNIVMFGPNDLLIEAKEILEDRIQEIDAIKFSYIDSLNSYMGHYVVLIDGNLYLYGIDLTRYLQRTIVHKNVISCVACSYEKASCEYNKIFPFVSICFFISFLFIKSSDIFSISLFILFILESFWFLEGLL